jgi:pyroglutamyl-peptidase
MAATILVTGFGPFPGAPFNPTGPLAERLARRPTLAGVKLVAHIFPTSYAAVDRDLPKLIAKHKPDALLMFGLDMKRPVLRIETQARNALSRLADVDGTARDANAIAPGRPATLALPTPSRRLLAVARKMKVPALISRNAGDYLCNYLSWRAVEASRRLGGPRVAAFIHVPKGATVAKLLPVGRAFLAAACHV